MADGWFYSKGQRGKKTHLEALLPSIRANPEGRYELFQDYKISKIFMPQNIKPSSWENSTMVSVNCQFNRL